MILLDTCALIFDALTPERLGPEAREFIAQGESERRLACADISLWEIAMLVAKGRLDPGTDPATFCGLVLAARGIRVLPIDPEIAAVSVRLPLPQGDPADRLIVATALQRDAVLLTCDERIRAAGIVATRW